MNYTDLERYVTLGALATTAATGLFVFSDHQYQTDSGLANLLIFGATTLSATALFYNFFNNIDKKNEKRDEESKLTKL